MKLKPEWKDPIVMLEKTIQLMDDAFNAANIHGMTKTEISELRNNHYNKVLPYREMLRLAKYQGYEFTDDELRQNILSPIFKL